MLARIQQSITIGMILVALTFAAIAIRAGSPTWSAVGILLIVGGYTVILALEFVMLAWSSGRDDPSTRATPVQLVKAWWGEVLTAPVVFCWRQPFRSNRVPDWLPEHNDRRGVVLVHGFVCNRGLWTPLLLRLRNHGIPFVAVNLEPVFGSIDSYADVIDAAVRRVTEHAGLPPVVVAHSMGGLAVRAWLASRGDDRLAHHIITVASPHRGTFLARFSLSPNAAQMRLGSQWLDRLSAREPPQRYANFTCFYGHCDNIVFPVVGAMLPGADNRHLDECAHVHMAYHPAVFTEVLRWTYDDPAAFAEHSGQPGAKQASPTNTAPASISASALTER